MALDPVPPDHNNESDPPPLSDSGIIVDPSHPLSVRLQKWLILSVLLALLGVGTDALALVLTDQPITLSGVLGKGALYMVAIAMVFSAAGEMLYDRTRLGRAGAWQVSLTLGAIIVAALFAIGFGFTKAGKSFPDSTARYSGIALLVALVLGLTMIVFTELGGSKRAR